ncbi:hypothetical protein AK812_SmicGene11478 [Symbiodinium microadriaticum]|uniref:Uncharacterized protein n=1 Tax=Symbiodinium microadriaticum TaxID=2951 RepID=A0A1Q9ED71_SYMMI|nr:hypothetical protein AK812_SmicGene11478 [Symbiodinium microadriaticum]
MRGPITVGLGRCLGAFLPPASWSAGCGGDPVVLVVWVIAIVLFVLALVVGLVGLVVRVVFSGGTVTGATYGQYRRQNRALFVAFFVFGTLQSNSRSLGVGLVCRDVCMDASQLAGAVDFSAGGSWRLQPSCGTLRPKAWREDDWRLIASDSSINEYGEHGIPFSSNGIEALADGMFGALFVQFLLQMESLLHKKCRNAEELDKHLRIARTCLRCHLLLFHQEVARARLAVVSQKQLHQKPPLFVESLFQWCWL